MTRFPWCGSRPDTPGPVVQLTCPPSELGWLGEVVESLRVVVKEFTSLRLRSVAGRVAYDRHPPRERSAAVYHRPVAGKHDAVGAEAVEAVVNYGGVFFRARAAGRGRFHDAGDLADDVLL